MKALGTGQVTAAQEDAHKLRTRGESKPYRHRIADLEKASRVHPHFLFESILLSPIAKDCPQTP